MLTVLNKRWLSQGWRVMDEADSEPMALVWIESLDAAKVPYEHYAALYRRSVDLRARRLELGMKCEDFSVDLMIACWPALAKEIEQKRIEEKRFLPSTAESVCERCFGSGMETVPGKGARSCGHEPLTESEIEEREKWKPTPPKPDPVEMKERPKPKTAKGILRQAMLDGGDTEKIVRIKEYLEQRNASEV